MGHDVAKVWNSKMIDNEHIENIKSWYAYFGLEIL